MELPYDPAIPFLGIYQEKNIVQKVTCIVSQCRCSTVYNSQDLEVTSMSIDRRMNKNEDVGHIYIGILLLLNCPVMSKCL